MNKKNNTTFETATGRIRHKMTNDFMFHVVFEENESALRMLLSSLLHMKPEEIKTVLVRNPIDYGDHLTSKKIILDLKLLLNSNNLVNIEMQVLNEKHWPERSLIYLCRSYDNVSKGEEYSFVFSACQISILSFDLAATAPAFYSTNRLINDKTGEVFASNFALSVLNLKRIELATDEDKQWKTDKWAKLFKAETWEELRMIAAEDVEMTNAAKTLYDKNQDEAARLWAQAREDFLLREESIMAEAAKAKMEAQKYRSLLVANGIDPDA